MTLPVIAPEATFHRNARRGHFSFFLSIFWAGGGRGGGDLALLCSFSLNYFTAFIEYIMSDVLG